MLFVWVIRPSKVYPKAIGHQKEKSYEDKAVHENTVKKKSVEHLEELFNKLWNNNIIIKYYEVNKINKGPTEVRECMQF